jgi:GxxExxY protein
VHPFNPRQKNSPLEKEMLSMTSESSGLKYEELTGRILKTYYEVYNELGHGFLESVYRRAMLVALTAAGCRVIEKFVLPVWFRGQVIGNFEADLMVDETVILELKAIRMLGLADEAQLLHYLRATEVEVGLLLNFGPEPQFKRMAFDNPRKK